MVDYLFINSTDSITKNNWLQMSNIKNYIFLIISVLLLVSCEHEPKQIINPTQPLPLTKSDKHGRIIIEDRNKDNIQQSFHPTKIALLVPLSGKYKHLGDSLLKSAQMALFDIDMDNIELLPFDTKGTSLGATNAMNKAVTNDVKLVIGPLFSDSTRAILNIGYENDVNIVSFSNDEKLIEEGVFLLGISPREEVKRILNYALDQNITLFNTLVPNNTYGAIIADELRNTVRQSDAYVPKTEFYHNNKSTIRSSVRRVMQSLISASEEKMKMRDKKNQTDELLQNPDLLPKIEYKALLIPDVDKNINTILSRIHLYNLQDNNILLLGNSKWLDNPLLYAEYPYVRDAWFAGIDPAPKQIFNKRFKSTYGYEAPVISALAYDAVALSAVLSKFGNDFSYAAITNKRGFIGASGMFRFRNNGSSQRALSIMQLDENGGVKVISPAPQSFLLLDQ